MATDHEDITYECSKRSAISDDNKDYLDDDLRVIAVIENQTSVTKRDGDSEARKICGSGKDTTLKTEVIHLDEASSAPIVNRNDATRGSRSYDNPRVIELSDNKSKMELRRQFKVDMTSHELSSGISSDSRRNVDPDGYGSADILSRLPPGTILIKQSSSCSATATTLGTTRSCSREDSDYVHDSSKESTGTNSSESSSAASYTALADKVKRIQYRTVRSKKIVQVRRNPARNKKKKPTDEDFSQRSRQRLLTVKRKASAYVVDPTVRKRARSVSTPYMNTRSVTRKMYNVGATYQAPTVHDAIEWKEWPSHGMHERPVWHPQIGLAYEYNLRTFMSLDGQTYREIIDEPIIEVVSVDPHPERTSIPYGRRRLDRVRTHSSTGSLEMYDKIQSVDQVNSFQACMHESLHSVLAYCARVVTPTYKKTVDMKLQGFSQAEEYFDHGKSDAKPTILTDVAKASQDANKMGIHSLLVPTSAAATKIPESSDVPSTSTSGQVPKCLVIPRKTIHFTNVRNIQGNILQEVFNRSSKNTLIFLKPTDPPGKTAEKIAAALKNSSAKIITPKSKDQTSTDSATVKLNLTKLDDNAISDEALMEMSSMYNTLLPIEDVECNSANKHANNITSHPVKAVVATKISKSSSESSLQENPKSNSELVHYPRFAYSNQAAEIAKILADYNQKPSKNSGLRNSCYASASSMLNVRAMTNVTMVKPSINNQESRNTFLSIVEQPKKIKLKREEDTREECLDYRIVVKQECSKNSPEIAITPEEKKMIKNDDIQAMDLTTAKPRELVDEKPVADKSDESRKWLQELIQDTALLYCAACGVHQDDVAEYFNTLDSAQSIQWLGS